MPTKFRGIAMAGFAMLALSCAVVVAPSGGPEDKTAPVVTGVFPAPAQLEVPTDAQPVLQFSEWIQPSIPRGAIFLSPPQAKSLRYEVEANRLRVQPGTLLDSGTTYTLTVSNALRDLRGNALAQPHQLIFSTGKQIDTLKITGNVLGRDRRTTPTVGLFPVGSWRTRWSYLDRFRDTALTREMDTLPRPHKEIPLFVAATDTVGRFSFGGLPPGRYLLAAFQDGNGNNRLDPQVELAGIGESEIVLNVPDSAFYHIALGDLDITPLRLESHRLGEEGQLELSFDRMLAQDSLWLDTSLCELWTIDSTRSFFPRAQWFNPDTRRPVLWFPQGPTADSLYFLKCKNARDSLGRQLDTLYRSLRLRWEIPVDTGPARLLHTAPRNNAQQVQPSDTLRLTFARTIQASQWLPSLLLQNGNDTLPFTIRNSTPVQLEIIPSRPLPLDAQVRLFRLQEESSLRRNDTTGTMDTVRQTRRQQLIQFNTRERLKTAELNGKIPGGSRYTQVLLRNISVDRLHRITCDSAGNFSFTNLVAGPHLLSYWQDLDLDGKHFPGALDPLRQSEPIRILTDTLQIPRGVTALETLHSELAPLPKVR